MTRLFPVPKCMGQIACHVVRIWALVVGLRLVLVKLSRLDRFSANQNWFLITTVR